MPSTPVIGVRTGGVPELIRDGETGFVLASCDDLESLTNSLVRLVEDEALRDELGEKAREWTHRQFNWPAAADAVKAIVWELSQ